MKTYSELIESLQKEARIARGYRSGGMPTGDERGSDFKPLLVWLDKVEKELDRKKMTYADVDSLDAVKLYNRDVDPKKAAKILISGKPVRENIELGEVTRVAVEKEFRKVYGTKMDKHYAIKHLEKKFGIKDVKLQKDKNGKIHVISFNESINLDEEDGGWSLTIKMSPASECRSAVESWLNSSKNRYKKYYNGIGGDQMRDYLEFSFEGMNSKQESDKIQKTIERTIWKGVRFLDYIDDIDVYLDESVETNEARMTPEVRGALEWWAGEVEAHQPEERKKLGYPTDKSVQELINKPDRKMRHHIKQYNEYMKKYGPFDEVPQTISEAEIMRWSKMDKSDRQSILRATGLPRSFSNDNWKSLDNRVRERLGRFINKSTEGEFKLAEARKGKPAPLPKATNFAIRMPIKDKKHDIELAKIVGSETDQKGLVQSGRKEGDSYVFYFKNARDRTKFRDKYLKSEQAPAINTGGVSGLTPDTVGRRVSKKKKKRKEAEVAPMLKVNERVDKAIKMLNSDFESGLRFRREINGHPVFRVSAEEFERCKGRRVKNERWNKFFENGSPNYDSIKKYSHKNPNKPVVVQNEVTGEMTIMRRRMNDGRLRHNRKMK
jgi:hypothetical protein